MRTFSVWDKDNNHVCPFCGTNESKEFILVPIQGTIEGNLAQAACVHTDCLQKSIILVAFPDIPEGDSGIIYARCEHSHLKEKEKSTVTY